MQPTASSFELRHDEPLRGSADLDAMRAAIPLAYTVKGMFLSPLAHQLGRDGWARVAGQLVDPPRGGRYLAFKDYSQRDHLALAWELARTRHPGAGARQGLRLVARQDFLIFGETVIGRVMLAIVGDPISALTQMPAAYDRVVTGQKMTAARTGPSSARIEVIGEDDGWEYNLGQVEGVVMHYGRGSLCRVEVAKGRYAIEARVL
ncbi:MAG: DUF2378 family protein [Polyangiaceae bacterium]|nr:DUF2378 family protein [Polyangiaceae bacterium]